MNRADQGLTTGAADVCIKQVNKQSLVSRDELKAILELDANAPKTKVQEIVDQPHCVLEARAGEDGVQVEREAYPLSSIPKPGLFCNTRGKHLPALTLAFARVFLRNIYPNHGVIQQVGSALGWWAFAREDPSRDLNNFLNNFVDGILFGVRESGFLC